MRFPEDYEEVKRYDRFYSIRSSLSRQEVLFMLGVTICFSTETFFKDN